MFWKLAVDFQHIPHFPWHTLNYEQLGAFFLLKKNK